MRLHDRSRTIRRAETEADGFLVLFFSSAGDSGYTALLYIPDGFSRLFRAKVYTRKATAAALIDVFRGVATKTDHQKTIVAIPDKLSAQQNGLNLCERVAVGKQ